MDRYWWQPVLLVCKSVVIKPFSRLKLRSKYAILLFGDLHVNWMVVKNITKSSFINFSSFASPSAQYIPTIKMAEAAAFQENLSQFNPYNCKRMEEQV